jgi:uncharacterized protein YgiM (DUF1202 family)
MRRTTIAIALLVGTVTAPLAAETTRWVERTKVDIRAGRGSFYEIVDTVLKGEQVEILKTEDKWASVRTKNAKTGWVYEAALKATPVQPGTSEFLKAAPGDTATSRTAASQGAKGAYAQGYAKEKGYDYGIVTWVEGHQPDGPQIEAFLKDPGEKTGGAR